MADSNTNTQKTFIVLVFITIAGLATVPSYLRLPLIKGLDPYLHWSSNFLGSRLAAGCLLATPLIVLLIMIVALYRRKLPKLRNRNPMVLYLMVIGFGLMPTVLPLIVFEFARLIFERFKPIFSQFLIPNFWAFYALSTLIGIASVIWGAFKKTRSWVFFGLLVATDATAQWGNLLTEYRWSTYIGWISTGLTIVITIWYMRFVNKARESS